MCKGSADGLAVLLEHSHQCTSAVAGQNTLLNPVGFEISNKSMQNRPQDYIALEHLEAHCSIGCDHHDAHTHEHVPLYMDRMYLLVISTREYGSHDCCVAHQEEVSSDTHPCQH